MILQGFFKCVCGKLHSYGGITLETKCKCGVYLWTFIMWVNR